MREAVAGYRQQNLHSELDGARQILEAAGITCTIEYTNRTLPPAADAALAWAVREGVTNVIRHSRARQCLIRVTSTEDYARVEVNNDGYLQGGSSTSQSGSGLSGLAERIAEQSGHIEAGPQSMVGSPGFRLWVEIPLRYNQIAEVR
jgi:two-component system sensor histidine kinase DesK